MPLKQLNHYKVNLHILSPIHVGTGQELDPFSFVIRDNRLCLIDLVKWMDEYSEKEELHNMMNSDNFAHVRTFIAEKMDVKSSMLCSIPIDSKELHKTYRRAIEEKDPRNQVLISPMTRNEVTMDAFIPGSSIKGSIRTAIANQFVQKAGVTSKDSGRGRSDYNQKIFGRINEDPMRWLKLSDVSLRESGTVIVEAKEYSRNPDKALTPKGHVEVALSLCQAEKSVIHPLRLSMAPFMLHGEEVNPEFLLEALYQFYVSKYEEEYAKFFRTQRSAVIQQGISPMNKIVKEMKTNETLIRIGHFSHVECVTLDRVRNPMTRKGKDGKPLPWGTTRTLANGVYPFGWCKLEFLDLEAKTRPQRDWPFSSEKVDKIITRKPPQVPEVKKIIKPKVDEEDNFSVLVKQLNVIEANDKLGMERMVESINRIKDESQQKQFGKLIKKKLEDRGMWKKHPLRFEIEMYLEDN